MKKIVLLFALAFVSTLSFAQVSWNVKGGMNISNWTKDTGADAKVGYKIGGGMEYAFDQRWALQTSLFLSSKGVKGSGYLENNSSADVTVNQVYLEMPIMAALRIPVCQQMNLVFSAGPYLAYGIAGKISAESGGVTGSVDTFGDSSLDHFDAGLAYGVAAEFGKIVVGAEGQFGLVKIMDVDGAPKNINVSLTVGYKF
ncbi:porin family protein [Bacteroides ihuae]|uniref:porin family protein n=1 Tax=Bacteroides ihuae TaxID=1852362 RepID=UPI0008D94DDA|nr:porin family protein [Bacteroides ihuae]